MNFKYNQKLRNSSRNTKDAYKNNKYITRAIPIKKKF